MSTLDIFRIHLVIGLVAWGLFVRIYWWPALATIDRRLALRQIAMLSAFRWEGLVFLMPTFVGPALPAAFALPAAYGDFATSILAIAAIVTFQWERAAMMFTVAYTLIGAVDLINNVYNVMRLGITPESFGIAYVIPTVYVPVLLISHGIAIWLLLKPSSAVARSNPGLAGQTR
jgi:hypothetical protein